MPSELISLPGFDSLMHELRDEYDVVLLDSPPLLLVTDALILSTKVSGTLIVVHAGITRRVALRRAVEVLTRGHGRILGLVLNGIDTRSTEYYASYGYYGGTKPYHEEALPS
jgi:Mrp family chromosome partitioning ATPase